MADEVDKTSERMDNELSLTVADLCRRAAEIPAGRAGDCYYCGEHFPRVVEVRCPVIGAMVEACGRCRDRRGTA